MRWPTLVGLALFALVVSGYQSLFTHWYAPPLITPRYVAQRHLGELRDSILRADVREGLPARAARVAPPRSGLVVVLRDADGALHALPDTARQPIDAAWQRVVGSRPLIPAVVVVDGSVRDPLIAPSAGPGSVCVSSHWTAQWVWQDHQLGPCAWYASLGLPSASVGDWVGTNGVLYDAVPSGFVSRDSTPAARSERILGMGFAASLAGLVPPVYDASADAVRCVEGSRESCFTATTKSDALPTGPWTFWGVPSSLGGYQSYLLRDLDREFGRQRLTAFWHSSAPMPAAFESAFGVPLSDWLAPHLRNYLGTVELGAGDVGRAALSALVWTVLLGLLGWWAARRLRY